MIVRFSATCGIRAYNHVRCEFEPVHGEVYSIHHYVIMFVRDLQQVGVWFSSGTPVSSTNKPYNHDITKILLKVALNTIILTLYI
jgi:hypothetical protein